MIRKKFKCSHPKAISLSKEWRILNGVIFFGVCGTGDYVSVPIV